MESKYKFLEIRSRVLTMSLHLNCFKTLMLVVVGCKKHERNFCALWPTNVNCSYFPFMLFILLRIKTYVLSSHETKKSKSFHDVHGFYMKNTKEMGFCKMKPDIIFIFLSSSKIPFYFEAPALRLLHMEYAVLFI